MEEKIYQEDELSSRNGQTTRKIIFYYTGTGNSLWIGRILAQGISNTELISILDWNANRHSTDYAVIGLIFPVHIWGVPRRVLSFLTLLKAMTPDYIFAVASNAGQVSNALVQLHKEMESKGLVLSSGWSVVMPSNYIPWEGPGPLEEQKKRFVEARIKLSAIAEKVCSRVKMPVEKGLLWQRILFTVLYKFTFPYVPKMDNKFWVNEECNQCGICVNICPTKNIKIQNEKIYWANNCEQCLACIQWCPQKALQYGKRTVAYTRYHHPEIKVKDLLK